jgi:uncharacterized protein HemY
LRWISRTDKPSSVHDRALTRDGGLDERSRWRRWHLGLGKLSRRTGKHEQAREHLTAALTMYREMGMTYWLAKAGTEMRELR